MHVWQHDWLSTTRLRNLYRLIRKGKKDNCRHFFKTLRAQNPWFNVVHAFSSSGAGCTVGVSTFPLSYFLDLNEPVLVVGNLQLRTGEAWQAYRRLLQHHITPKVLYEVVFPNIYTTFTRLLDLWALNVTLLPWSSPGLEVTSSVQPSTLSLIHGGKSTYSTDWKTLHNKWRVQTTI